MKAAAVVLLAVLMIAAPVYAVTLRAPDGTPTGPPWQTWADQSRAPSPPGEITFTTGTGPCGEVADGCARWWDDGTAEVWVTPDAHERATLLHELGHIFDGRVMTDNARAAWKAATGDWRSGWMVTAPDGLSRSCTLSCEWFAEGYARCALHGPNIRQAVHGAYGYVAGPVRQRRACRVLRMAAAGVYG